MNALATMHVRRPCLLKEGEPLILARSAMDTAVRFQAFADESGIPQSSVLTTPVCAMPLPIYDDFEGHRRWPGTQPEVLWHPLMWLPPRVAGRYALRDPQSGAERIEDDILWAIRVGVELTASGLYNKDSGTWFDVLAHDGIDIEDPADVARVRRWLDGAPDQLLDSIDLSEYLDREPSSWALEYALKVRDDVERASWAVIADDLLDLADELVDADESDARRVEGTQSLAGLARSLLSSVLSSVPTVSPSGRRTSIDNLTHREFFTRLDQTADTVSPGELTFQLIHARARLDAIREIHWPSVDRLAVLEMEENL